EETSPAADPTADHEEEEVIIQFEEDDDEKTQLTKRKTHRKICKRMMSEDGVVGYPE
ncbi:Hypothetical protein FKW44_016679, partial [Caligus rogercresseyi]